MTQEIDENEDTGLCDACSATDGPVQNGPEGSEWEGASVCNECYAKHATADDGETWMVRLFTAGELPSEYYHTGRTDLPGNAIATRSTILARKYTKDKAKEVAAKLGGTLSGVWKAVDRNGVEG